MNAVSTPSAASGRPLAISLLLGVSGWFAGIFMLIFVALLIHPDGAASAAVTGIVLLAAAWGLFMVAHDGAQVFVAQLALALAIAGQCLVVYAMSSHARSIGPIAAAALVLQVVLALVMPNRLHRTLSTLFATIAWALTVRFVLFDAHADWHRDHPPQATALPAALGGWLLTWGPVAAALWWALRNETAWAARGWAALAQPLTTGLIAGLAFATLASQPLEEMRWFGGANAGSLALWPLLSALAALGALAAAFAQGRRGLMALCAVAALLHVGCFYYALGTSLLLKSLLMLAMGVACIVAARVLRSKEVA